MPPLAFVVSLVCQLSWEGKFTHTHTHTSSIISFNIVHFICVIVVVVLSQRCPSSLSFFSAAAAVFFFPLLACQFFISTEISLCSARGGSVYSQSWAQRENRVGIGTNFWLPLPWILSRILTSRSASLPLCRSLSPVILLYEAAPHFDMTFSTLIYMVPLFLHIHTYMYVCLYIYFIWSCVVCSQLENLYAPCGT